MYEISKDFSFGVDQNAKNHKPFIVACRDREKELCCSEERFVFASLSYYEAMFLYEKLKDVLNAK